jgi:hypothetical protein
VHNGRGLGVATYAAHLSSERPNSGIHRRWLLEGALPTAAEIDDGRSIRRSSDVSRNANKPNCKTESEREHESRAPTITPGSRSMPHTHRLVSALVGPTCASLSPSSRGPTPGASQESGKTGQDGARSSGGQDGGSDCGTRDQNGLKSIPVPSGENGCTSPLRWRRASDTCARTCTRAQTTGDMQEHLRCARARPAVCAAERLGATPGAMPLSKPRASRAVWAAWLHWECYERQCDVRVRGRVCVHACAWCVCVPHDGVCEREDRGAVVQHNPLAL